MKIFWSWQSGTPGKIGRFFVRDALRDAIEELKQAPEIEEPTSKESREAIHLDQDIQDTTGSPDLARTILAKIDASTVVVADVTLVGTTLASTNTDGKVIPGKKLINSNVAIELGYAFRRSCGVRCRVSCGSCAGGIFSRRAGKLKRHQSIS